MIVWVGHSYLGHGSRPADFGVPETGKGTSFTRADSGHEKEFWRLQPVKVRGQMNRIAISITLLLLLMSLASCNKAPNQPASQVSSAAKRYHLKGKVVSIDKQSKMPNIDREAIPDF